MIGECVLSMWEYDPESVFLDCLVVREFPPIRPGRI